MRRVDAAAALGLWLLAALEGDAWLAAGLVTLPVALRRTHTAVALAAQLAAMLCLAAAGAMPDAAGASIAVAAMAYTAGRAWPRRRAVPALVAMETAAALALVADDGVAALSDLPWFGGVFFAAPWLAGRALRSRAARVAELEALTVELELERERATALAAETERARIARDLQGVLAAALQGMTARAAAAEPAPAAADFEAVRAEGAAAAAELRRLLRLLH